MSTTQKPFIAATACLGAMLGSVTVAFAIHRQEPVAEPPIRRDPPIYLPRPIPRPPFLPPIAFSAGVTVKSIAVNTVIRGGVAETEVTHVFTNPNDREAEGDFIFPIPANATVSSFAMYDGDKKMDARLLDQDEAVQTYEEIVRRRRDPALLTYDGRSALRARLFPIPAHSDRKITLKLVTVLQREGDAKKFAWTLIGPYLPGNTRPQSVSVRVSVEDGAGNLYSPTHDVQIKREGEATIATWAADSANIATLTENPDFDLYIAPKGGAGSVALSVLTYDAALPETASLGGGARQSGYFLVVASPNITAGDHIAPPRRVILIMDRSGSMQGKKIEQAKGALKFALGKLRPQDSFNVMTFSDAVEKFSPEPIAASSANIERADAFIDDMVADGGTNIHDALDEGLSEFPERSSGNTLLFFTDGLPTVGTTDQGAIVREAVERNGRKARAFFFGVGYDVDVPFLDSVAQSLRGDADYVRPDEDIEVKTSHFVAKTSEPVLENLKLTVNGGLAKTGEIYPRPSDLPDLFAGGQLVLVGRYTGSDRDVHLTLTGEANGKPQTYTLNASFPDVDTHATFLPRLWASRKIGYLMDEVRLKEDGPAKQEAIAQITSLSKEWGILTPYTALFVPEPELVDSGPRPVPLLGVRGTGRVYSNAGAVGGGGFGGGAAGFAGADAPAAIGAPSFADRSGESAVNYSQTARQQKVAAQVSNVLAYSVQAGSDRDRNEALANHMRNIAQRTFVLRGNVWTDATYDPKKQTAIVKIKLYSDAYFALTRRSAAFAKWAALGDNVLIAANQSQAVQFGADGKETLTDAEVTALAGK